MTGTACGIHPTPISQRSSRAHHPADLAAGRYGQKAKYGGELLVGTETATRMPFQVFFQLDKNGDPKGIVRLI